MTKMFSGNTTFWIVLVLIVLLLIAVTAFRSFLHKPFRVEQKPILTDNEIEFFGRLREALPDFEVFPQVCMGAILKPAAGSGENYARIRATFSQKIIDFTVCVPGSLQVIALIELDDRTHNAQKDARRDSITGAAGIPTLRWQSKRRPSPADIRSAVLDIAARAHQG